ncbi:dihydroneopterin aldolase [Thiomicrospira sp. ALE5]|uniref:dihydroneopterin aldolase n=1 Tax=Thiomicrospira sp. ALE5 TaxID=748650 RepID=UPI0008E3ED66|nr:dihydroneopterin aldolase [Thiomicrospira sp. ALE5]SFR61015.1 dihydroneopterin aldolase [Thiomicrospira sp. ALE5]
MNRSSPPSDYIFIDNLRINTLIGIHAWEQVQPQPLVFSLKLYCDFTPVFNSAQLEDSIDYAAVASAIEQHCQTKAHRLIETLAHDILTHLLSDFPLIQGIELTLAKPHAVAASQQVGLQVTRWRN